MFQGIRLQRELFRVVNEKFNPRNLNEKIIKSEGISIEFQNFKYALSKLNDKKALGTDSLPVSALKRLGYR